LTNQIKVMLVKKYKIYDIHLQNYNRHIYIYIYKKMLKKLLLFKKILYLRLKENPIILNYVIHIMLVITWSNHTKNVLFIVLVFGIWAIFS
jgi:hypothetical protein